MSNNKNTIETLLMGVYQLFKRGEINIAFDAMQKLKLDWPKNAKALQLEALILKAKGEYKGAIDCLVQSLELNPTSSETHNSLANVHRDCENWTRSIRHYKEALKLDPEYMSARRNLALCYAARGETHRAINAFNEILSTQPNDVSSLVAMANCEREQHNFDKAELNYAKAVAINNTYFNAWYNRGLNARLQSDNQLAKDCFVRAYELQADNESLAVSMANFEVEEGQIDVAIKRLNDLVEQKPTAITVHKELDRLFWEAGDAGQVTQSLNRAAGYLPDNIEIHIAYTEQLLLANNVETALSVIQDTLNKFGPQSSILSNRAKCYALIGDAGKAIDDYSRSLELNHENSVANDLVQLLLTDGDLQQAQSILNTNFDNDNLCQLSWAMQGLLWREQNDERYDWLHQYEQLVKSYTINVPDGYSDISEYLNCLNDSLIGLHITRSAPLDQTLRNGTQTTPKLFSKQINEIQVFKELCTQIVDEYLTSLRFDDQHPFLNRMNSEFEFSGSWSVRLYNKGFHVNHVHPEGWISSSTYISVPKLNTSSDEGCIKFGEASFLQSSNNRIEKTIRPENGMVVLFPSYTWHGTIPFTTNSEEIRLTAPFDVQPKISL